MMSHLVLNLGLLCFCLDDFVIVTDIDARLSFYSGFVKRSLHQIFDHSYIKRNVFFTFDSTCAVSHGQSNSLN